MRSATVIAAAASAVLSAGATPGRTQSLDPPGSAFTATVASSDAFALVLRADNGELVTFPADDPWTIPAGLVPGTRVTVRYEVVDGNGYRLVGVKIASGPIEPGSTTDPPPMPPEPASAAPGIRKRPGTSPALPRPELEEPSPRATPELAGQSGGPPPPAGTPRAALPAGPAEGSPPSSPAPARDADDAVAAGEPLRAAAVPLPGMGEAATLVTLLLAAGALLWAACARR